MTVVSFGVALIKPTYYKILKSVTLAQTLLIRIKELKEAGAMYILVTFNS